jgi:hypothetical protein
MTIWRKHIDAVDHVKNAPIQGNFRRFQERGMTINESMARDNAILLLPSKNDKAFTSIG